MNAETRCRGCGNLLAHGALNGLCPVCLLREGLAGAKDEPAWSDTGPFMSGPHAPAGALASLDRTLGGLPRVLLRDSELSEGPGLLVQPGSPEMPAIGDRSGRLQLLGEIARGGMGAVLKGRDPDLGRDVAVKVLLESHRDKPDLIRRFIEEAQIGGQLQHPGIVPIYELGAFADRRPYFALKLVKGRTLSSLLDERSDRVHDLPRFLSIFEAVCQTIAYAHARGVIHRDLKPSNIMVGSFGEVQVMDWGLAKVLPQGGAADDVSTGKTRERETVIATARSAGNNDSDLSRAGSVMGTPSYMAPEQARGEVDRLDERCDVFALGSILCELLTGEPAFTGRSSGEIQRKASRGELKDALDRLEGCGSDAELTALTKDCLAPELEDRPRHAGEVAARINAYQTGVQERLRLAEIARAEEKARAEEATKRARVERDRLRLTVALAAAVLGLVLLGGGGAFWFVQQRQDRLTGVEATVARIQAKRDQAAADGADAARWREALAAADQALASIGDLAASQPGRRLAALRAKIAEGQTLAERDRKLIEELASLRTSVGKGTLENHLWDTGRFTRAFKRYGLDLEATPIKDAVARLKSRPDAFVREVVGSLDHWLIIRHDLLSPTEQEPKLLDLQKILDLAQGLDSDPERNRLRALLKQADLKSQLQTLGAIARQTKLVEFGPSTALLLARSLHRAGDAKNAIAVLRAAVVRYPGDLWTNYELATLLSNADPPQADESIRFYTAARALRPETGWYLAEILQKQGRDDEAEALLVELARLDPVPTPYLLELPKLLCKRGKKDEARSVVERMIAPFRERLRQEPNDALTFRRIALVLFLSDDWPGAVAPYREAARLDPKDAECRRELGFLLFIQRDLPGAIAAYREAIRIDPTRVSDHYALAAALERTGDEVGEIAELREAIRIERLRQDPGLLFDPGTFDDLYLEMATGYLDGMYQVYLGDGGYKLGSALRLTGDLPGAIAAYREAISGNPELTIEARYGLGMTLAESGDVPGAIAAFREAIQHDHRHQVGPFRLLRAILMAQRPDEAIAALRRVREQARDDGTIGRAIDLAISQFEQLSKLGARIPRFFHLSLFSEGSLAEQCYGRQFFAASAAIWSAGFAADPKLAEDMKAQNRYNAACAAALAAAGKGIEQPPLEEPAKARWRIQALDWLKADLAYWAKQSKSGAPEAKALVRKTLQQWKADADLASVRDEKELTKLPEPERKTWRALWSEVAALLKKPEKS
ncbi:MAG: protein kinase [Isosphaerales bacterium]